MTVIVQVALPPPAIAGVTGIAAPVKKISLLRLLGLISVSQRFIAALKFVVIVLGAAGSKVRTPSGSG